MVRSLFFVRVSFDSIRFRAELYDFPVSAFIKEFGPDERSEVVRVRLGLPEIKTIRDLAAFASSLGEEGLTDAARMLLSALGVGSFLMLV